MNFILYNILAFIFYVSLVALQKFFTEGEKRKTLLVFLLRHRNQIYV